jgi:spore maturation protein CgeB
MKILCVGPQWRGSNAGALFRAFSRIGHLISVLDENYFINFSNSSKSVKLLDWIFRSWHIKEFNNAIIRECEIFKPDIVLVYKGAFVLPEMLSRLKRQSVTILNFYPDVSFHTHGNLLQKTLPLYDIIFTTKTFGVKDMAEQLGQQSGVFIPHGFDPDIHRPLTIEDGVLRESFSADVSFIGTWSRGKQTLLEALVKGVPGLKLKIWGSQWEKASTILRPFCQGRPITGDLYAAAIGISTINLGLMSEQVLGASSGDLITSRTFHIPASGGFMLHQRSPEVGNYFVEDKEAVFFDGPNELVEKVKYYLNHVEKRNTIRMAGHHRALKQHSLDDRAKRILTHLASTKF